MDSGCWGCLLPTRICTANLVTTKTGETQCLAQGILPIFLELVSYYTDYFARVMPREWDEYGLRGEEKGRGVLSKLTESRRDFFDTEVMVGVLMFYQFRRS